MQISNIRTGGDWVNRKGLLDKIDHGGHGHQWVSLEATRRELLRLWAIVKLSQCIVGHWEWTSFQHRLHASRVPTFMRTPKIRIEELTTVVAAAPHTRYKCQEEKVSKYSQDDRRLEKGPLAQWILAEWKGAFLCQRRRREQSGDEAGHRPGLPRHPRQSHYWLWTWYFTCTVSFDRSSTSTIRKALNVSMFSVWA